MYSKFWPKGGLPGILHHYTGTLVTFEFTTNTRPKPHSIVFIGGLGDGLATTSYLADVVHALEPTPWSLFTLNLTSSYTAWGLGDLSRDAIEIGKCLSYVQEYKASKLDTPTTPGKLVIFGHSTGSQGVLHYLTHPVDAAIMQAPISDREVLHLLQQTGFGDQTPQDLSTTISTLIDLSRKALSSSPSHQSPTEGESDLSSASPTTESLLPLSLTSRIYPSDTPLSARRFLSLASPESPQNPSAEDFFSSDLSSAQLAATFGRIGTAGWLKTKLLVLVSGGDQAVPEWVGKEALLARWQQATDEGSKGKGVWDRERSGVILGASHALSNDDQGSCRQDLLARVLGFLEDVEKV